MNHHLMYTGKHQIKASLKKICQPLRYSRKKNCNCTICPSYRTQAISYCILSDGIISKYIHKIFPVISWVKNHFFPAVNSWRRNKIRIQKSFFKYLILVPVPVFYHMPLNFHTGHIMFHFSHFHIENHCNISQDSAHSVFQITFIPLYIYKPDKKFFFYLFIIIQKFNIFSNVCSRKTFQPFHNITEKLIYLCSLTIFFIKI